MKRKKRSAHTGKSKGPIGARSREPNVKKADGEESTVIDRYQQNTGFRVVGALGVSSTHSQTYPFGWFVSVVIIVVTFISFFPLFQNGFVDVWDDGPNLIENPEFRGLGWPQLRWMFTTFFFGHYQPLSWVTLGLDYLVWGMNPIGYHLTNLVLHSLNAVLFYFLSVRLLGKACNLSREDSSLRLGGVAAAVLFAIHPLRVESVAWATERRDVLSALFFLLAVHFYLRAAEAENHRGYVKWLVATVVVYVLSLLSKALGITLPVVLLILDIYPLRRLGIGQSKWIGPAVRHVWLEKLPFVALALILGWIALLAQYQSGAMEDPAHWGPVARFSQFFYSLVFYVWKTAVPIALSPLYELPEPFIPWDWPFVASGVAAVTLTSLFFALRNRCPGGLTIWLFYVALLAPVSGIAQSGPQLVADRYSYISCLGWALLYGRGIRYLSQRWLTSSRQSLVVAVGATIIPALVLGALTWKQTQVWRDSETLFSRVLAFNPRSRVAHSNLGHVLLARGGVDEAIGHFRKSLEIGADFLMANYGLADALSRQGKFDEAVQYYQRTLRIDPEFPEAHDNLGVILARRERLDEAMEHFQRALRFNPGLASARLHLGEALISRGQLDEAIVQLREALRVQPHFPEAQENLALALARRGNK